MFATSNRPALASGEAACRLIGGIKCVVLPQGPHRIGSQGVDRFANGTERPAFEVTLATPVAIARDPVTEADYQEFAHSSVRPNTPLPVVNVSWNEARDYCVWLARWTTHPWRLPSETEWEIGCRAGSDTPFATGHALPVADANYYYEESGERIGIGSRSPTGSYPGNAWGLRDMHGNVCEWCEDAWAPSHEGASADGLPRKGASHDKRVIRGGAWDLLPRLCRSSWRDALPPLTRRDNVGFRIAVTIAASCG